MNILIGADLVPTKSNIDLFIAGDAVSLVGTDLYELMHNADYRIFNLEVPLTDREQPISKCGPNLIAPTKCIAGYKSMQVDLLTLANNHILDQDQQGLDSTLKALEQAGISYTGVGNTPEEAAKPYVFECEGKKIGVYACAEHEFSIVTEHSAGANPIDLLESPDHVSELKAQCDFVIVLYHGGKEHYRYPSPNLQKVCRKLVEKGADLVLCQHSHCIGCEEKYRNGTIVYGQGNFLFDASESEYWQNGLLVQVNTDYSISYIPIVKNHETVRLATKEEGDMSLSDFYKRSQEIKSPCVIENKYSDFAKSMLYHYFIRVSSIKQGFVFKAINKLSGHRWASWMIKRRYSKQSLLAIENFISCEAHHELFIKGIEVSDS